MTENNPPPNSTAGAPDTSRGMPYYEKLRRDLREALQKKKQIDKEVAEIDEQILARETAYLEETSAGNIIKGFDNYIKGTAASTTAGAGPTARRKAQVNDAERIFSRSSSTYMKEASTPGSTATTPSLAATPSASGFQTRENSQGAANKAGKLKKKAPDDDDSEGKPATKRGKITYGRD